jgi:ParB-like chromosome segregation protein Spo0J
MMMQNRIQLIPIENLIPHPDNPNRMSKKKFAKLIRNIERTSRYEPLVVRPCQGKTEKFQIVNGQNRWKALYQLDYKTVEVIVWDIDDEEADILLATLNRLGGSDVLEKRLALMERLTQRQPCRDLAQWLPHTAGQIHRLAQMNSDSVPQIKRAKPALAHPLVFFLNDVQKEIVEKALSNARGLQGEKTKAAKKAAALTLIAQQYNLSS